MEENEKNPLPIAEAIGSGFFDLVMTEDGTIIYTVSENAEEINPIFYAVCRKVVADELMELARRGFIEYRFDNNLDLEYRFTKEGIEHMRSKGYNIE